MPVIATTRPSRTKRSSNSSSTAMPTVCATATAATIGSMWYSRYCSTATGSVVTPGLLRNSASSRFSNEMTKANSAPAMMPGRIAGSVTRQITCSGWAPRLAAASSAARSCVARLARQSRTTQGVVIMTCASTRPVSEPVSAEPMCSSIGDQHDVDGEAERDARHGDRGEQQRADQRPAAEAMARQSDAGGHAQQQAADDGGDAELQAGPDRRAEGGGDLRCTSRACRRAAGTGSASRRTR